VSSTFKLYLLMESKKINQLATNVAPQTSDLTIIGDPITGVSKKITLLQIANLFATTGTVTSVAVTETGNALTITGSPITSAGTINIGFAGDATQYVRGDGALADFPTSTGGGSSVSYYLNSSVSQGTIGGVAYREFSKDPIAGAGTDITASTNGYIASYITDANDPALLEVPAGNFNCELYFSVNSNAHNPYVYAEVYKYDGTTFTLIGSSQSVPEYLTNGTTLSPYYFAIPVTQTTLAITDRIAIRIYVNVDTRTVTLHTENNHLCQVVTTFSKGLTSLNNLTRQVQFLATGTSGTDFNISSSTATHTFNLPVASATNTGKLSSTDWSTFNGKQPAGNYVTLDTTQTITAAKTFSGVNTFSQNPVINGTGTNSAYTILQSDGTNKWRIGNNYASGVNTFDIFAYDNSTTPLSINSNGAMTLSANVTTTGAQFVQNGFYLTNANGGALAGYTLMHGSDNGINFALRNLTGGASFIFQSASSYSYTFPAAAGTLALTSNLSAYLPLTGGTLTGALSGTSATFSGNGSFGGTTGGDRLNIENSGTTSYCAMRVIHNNSTADFYVGIGGSAVGNATLQNNAYLMNAGASGLALGTSNAVRMFITSGGNVGIGTSSPSGKLEVVPLNENGNEGIFVNQLGSRQSTIRFKSAHSANSDYRIGASILVDSAFEIYSINAATSRMVITSGGKLCVQSTTTIFTNSANRINGVVNSGGEAALEVSNSGTTDGSPAISCYKANATTNSDARFIQFYASAGTTAMGGIVGNGTSNVQFASISDIREKENIETIKGSLNKILALNAVEFDWIKTKEHVNGGFVAQQVEEIFPEFVVNNMANSGEEERKGLTGGMSSGIIAHLVSAIQEQQAQIEELKAKIK
jgi:hypothetical protein